MKALTRFTFLFSLIVLAAVFGTMAQRVIKGTVYMDGKPAAGVTVEAHKGSSMMTSFDGKYDVTADPKSKYLKFTFIDESKKFDLDENSVGKIDFAFTGVIPGAEGSLAEAVSDDVILKTAEELLNEQDKEFMNHLSFYSEFFKQGDYQSALPHWEILYHKYPKSTSNIYIHGTKIYESLIENAKTDAERDKYLDEVMKMADQRIKYFGGKGFVFGRKGTTWLKYKLDEKRVTPLEGEDLKIVLQTGYDWLSTSVDMEKTATELPIFLLQIQASKSLFKMGSLQKEVVISNYNKCNRLLSEIESKTTDQKKIKEIKEIQAYIETVFNSSGAI